MRIGVPKERRPHELRVAASPDTVKRLTGEGIEVLVEKGAGAGALIADEAFAAVGARIVDQPEALYQAADLVLKVRRPLEPGEDDVDEMAWLRQGLVLIGLLDPLLHHRQVETYASAGVIAFAMEMLPRTTRAQAMDVLSSQANLAGYRAVLDGLAAFSRVMPMMMTAAGTVPPAKVFVIGAGVAGLQAIATARRLGAVVSATDVRPAAKEEVESLGAKFVGAPVEDAATRGGYAKELAEAQQQKQRELLAETLRSQDLVITTAQVPGRKAPLIVTARDGGRDEAGRGAGRHGGRFRRQLRAQQARQDGTTQGRGHHRAGQSALGAGAGLHGAVRAQSLQLRPAADRQGQQGAGARPRRRPGRRHHAHPRRQGGASPPDRDPRRLIIKPTEGRVTMAAIDPGLYNLIVFVLAIFVGYYVVWSVTPALHTPLMSVTNAISSVIIVGALIATGPAGFSFSKVIGFLAVILASVNIFGGFLVTQRMLGMYKKRG